MRSFFGHQFLTSRLSRNDLRQIWSPSHLHCPAELVSRGHALAAGDEPGEPEAEREGRREREARSGVKNERSAEDAQTAPAATPAAPRPKTPNEPSWTPPPK